MHAVRRLLRHEWRSYRDLRLRALADSPDAFGSTLEVEAAKPDAFWEDRLSSAADSPLQLPLAAESRTELVGLAWGWIDPANPAIAHIFQMWVAPEARGQGIGVSLLNTVVSWARAARVTSVVLMVTCGNSPARQLYERAGFVAHGDPAPLRPGSSVLAQPMVLSL
jgi:ribosomal protein S18 acetylase RimI-like enzyme